jgi:small subunit ribosomal protein S17
MQNRKTFTGVITSNRMDKTVVVKVTRTVRHPKYGKVIQISKKFYAHTESDNLQIGDTVQIIETRPLSKLKRWRVAN